MVFVAISFGSTGMDGNQNIRNCWNEPTKLEVTKSELLLGYRKGIYPLMIFLEHTLAFFMEIVVE